MKKIISHKTRVLSLNEIQDMSDAMEKRRQDEIRVCIWTGSDRYYRHLETNEIVEQSVPHFATMDSVAIGLMSFINNRFPDTKITLENRPGSDEYSFCFIYDFHEDALQSISYFESGWVSSIAEAIFYVTLQIIEWENLTKEKK
jgi:hypothetical protein